LLGSEKVFARPSLPQTWPGIIGWWEKRRLFYNAILFAVVIASALISPLLRGHLFEGYGRAASTTFLISLIFLLIPGNIFYTGGWFVDLILKKVFRMSAAGFGPWALGCGIVFSLAMVALAYVLFWELYFP
jgi:uncharacterized membrane protein YjjB (DUF3815 family)